MTPAEQLADLRQRLAAKVAEWRERADDAGAQAHALTYRYVADEIEAVFRLGRAVKAAPGQSVSIAGWWDMDPTPVAEPVFAYGEREE